MRQPCLNLYFKNDRASVNRNITHSRYQQLFGNLSETQKSIIDDKDSQHIIVAAGPGSGKTRVLALKLASLLLMEDVKREQLLMLTFSRAAATEFKKRLIEYVGSTAYYVDVKTFHSYCFDLLGRIGSLDKVESVIEMATEMIRNGEVEQDKITKSVLVIDEAQDMSVKEFALVESLMLRNETMKVIAVGDDDQNIYEFRQSDSKYFASFASKYDANFYEMNENFRSTKALVDFSNQFVQAISGRLKTRPAVATRSVNGQIELTEYQSEHFEEAVVEDFLQQYQKGSCALLTETNEEAFLLDDLLKQQGIDAHLIQNRADIRLCDLLELRSFLVSLKKQIGNQVTINSEQWANAKKSLDCRFEGSANLLVCHRLIELFESIVPKKVKYLSDWEEFVRESEFQDCCVEDRSKNIFVSTVHKAKGHEFDDVFLVLKTPLKTTDSEKRRVYVGLTRAKNRLFIHSNEGVFSDSLKRSIVCHLNSKTYNAPNEIVFSLTLEDVYLSFSEERKNLICSLRAGSPLIFAEDTFYINDSGKQKAVSKLSRKFRLELEKLIIKGYLPSRAEVGFVVAWKDKEKDKTLAVLLPYLYLTKQRDQETY